MRYIAVSPKWMSLYGLECSMAGRLHYEVFPEIPERWKEIHRRALSGEILESPEDFFVRADGSIAWCRWECRPWRKADGSIGGILLFVEDLTACKRAELELRKTLERMKVAQEAAQIGIWDWDLQTGETYLNNFYYDLYGLPHGVPLTYDDYIGAVHPDDREGLQAKVGAAFAGGGLIDTEVRIIRANDGAVRWLVSRGKVLFDDAGKPIRVMGTVFDMTERKLAEEEARQTADRLKLIQATARIGTWELDFQTGESKVSDVLLGLYGLPQGAPITHADFMALVHPEDRSLIDAFPRGAVKSEMTVIDVQFRIVRVNDGAIRWMASKGGLQFDDRGRPIRKMGIIFDITERKESEEALRQSEAELRLKRRELDSIYKHAPIGMCYLDRDLTHLRINRQLADMNGLPIEENIGRTVHELLPSVAPRIEEAAQRIIATGEAVRKLEFTGEMPPGSGEIRSWMTCLLPVSDDDGEMIGFSVLVDDVTERKQAEDALRESEARLKVAQSAAHIGIWNWDVQSDIASFDDVGIEYLGLTQGVPLQYSDYLGRVPEEERHIVNSALETAFAGDGRVLLEHRLINAATGVARWVSCRGRFTFDDEGRPLRGTGAVYDITERKRAEAALQESEAEARQQRDELEWFYRNLPIGLAVFDLDLKYRRVNRWLADFNNLPIESHIGKTIFDIVPDYGDQARRAKETILATGEALRNMEYTAESPRNPGVARHVNINWHPLFREEGALIGFTVLVEDITERKRAEAALLRSEARARQKHDELQWIYENAPVGLAFLDRDLRFQRINRRLAEMNGYPMEAHIGRTVVEIVPALSSKFEQLAESIVATGEPVRNIELEVETNARPGVARYWEESWYPAFNAEGSVTGFSVVVEEITESKHLQALREADRRKDEFLATLAHEIRNPLVPIKNAIHLLQMLTGDDPTSDQKRRVALSRAERQVKHLVRLVDDLLEVTRINHGKIELQKEPVELAAVLSQAIDLSHSQIEAGPHQLIIELQSKSMKVNGDAVRLAQVFSNLLNNAAKFTDAGGRIEVVAGCEGGYGVVRVRDNGVGIPPEMASSIFDMFTQIRSGTRSGRGGIGIGLAISRGIIQMHGGRIEARSDGPGCGSEFIVHLPLIAQCATTKRIG